SYGTSQNPVDSTAQGVHRLGYAEFARLVAQSPRIDGVIVVVTARRSAFLENDLQKLKDLARNSTKPVFMWTYTLPSARSVEILNEAGYPLFTGANSCARTMRAMVDYRTLRERLLPPSPTTNQNVPDREKVRALLTEAGSVLCEYRARPLLSAYGIGVENAGYLVQSPDEAAAAARAIGQPVALKVQSADIPHKTEAGAIALNLSGDAVRDGYHRVLAAAKRYSLTARVDGVFVQPMAAPGREVILGVNRDPTWGPLLMIGLGGVLVEAVGDVALTTVPLDNATAHALIVRLKGAQVFGPYRGAPPADVDALADLLVRLSQFATDFADDISQIDLNPILVHASGQGVTIVDALVVKRTEQPERHAAAE
ncbi:MAG: acetate--CoA ligase family protein, partial [Pseudolabrys sp.]